MFFKTGDLNLSHKIHGNGKKQHDILQWGFDYLIIFGGDEKFSSGDVILANFPVPREKVQPGLWEGFLLRVNG